MSDDLLKVLLGSLSAIITGIVGITVGRLARPYGHRLERLWELRAKAPEGDTESRAYLDEEVSRVIQEARQVKYRAAVLVLQLVLSFAFFVFIPASYTRDFAQGFGFGLGRAAGGDLPDRLVFVAVVVLVGLYVGVIFAVLRSGWTVVRYWYKIARSWGASKLLLRTLLGLLVLLFVLVSYAIRNYA